MAVETPPVAPPRRLQLHPQAQLDVAGDAPGRGTVAGFAAVLLRRRHHLLAAYVACLHVLLYLLLIAPHHAR